MRLPVTLLLLSCVACRSLHPQRHLTTPRQDGHSTPFVLYKPANPSNTCAPLAVISHGAGGSENGYRYLANAMAGFGYTTLVMGHAESGPKALMKDAGSEGIRPGLMTLVADPEAERDRLLDLDAVLAWADAQCHPPFRVLLGHSMGSSTVMLEAGARNLLGIPSPPAGQNRFDAYVALSPDGPGIVFPDHAWSAIRKPVLVLTGTRDRALNGGPEIRQIPWQQLPGTSSNCQWLAVIDNATHMNFAGAGFDADSVEPKVTQTIAEFLKGSHAKACSLPAPIPATHLQAK